MNWHEHQVLPKPQSGNVSIWWMMTLVRAGLDLSAFVLLLLSTRTIMRFVMYILERKVAMAGKTIKIKLTTSILGTILTKLEMKAEVVTVLQVIMNRPIYITFLKTLGHIPVVRSRNLIANQLI